MTAAKTIEMGRLYGLIAPILPDGEFIKCEPVFIDYWLYKHPSAYYVGVKQTYGKKIGISHFEEIDIRAYGAPIFLPASHKKVNNGKKYFIIFQKTKNYSITTYQFPTVSLATPDSSYIYTLNTGILFPNKFITMIADKDLSEEEMLAAIR